MKTATGMISEDSVFNPDTPYIQKGIPSAVLGVITLLFTELMFFAALISAFIVNRADVPASEWPPPGQPRLPVLSTLFNSLFLLVSAFTLALAVRKYKKDKKIAFWLILTILLASLFILLQGAEWVRLINFGMTSSSGLYAAFFYTIVGAHAFHALFGVAALIYIQLRIRRNKKKNLSAELTAGALYWFFVVGIWPVLYILVYLS